MAIYFLAVSIEIIKANRFIFRRDISSLTRIFYLSVSSLISEQKTAEILFSSRIDTLFMDPSYCFDRIKLQK